VNRILVDPDNGVPPWRQIKDQLVRLILAGELPIGAQLPSIRQLARDLGLATGTVARVYRELEATGVLRTAGRGRTARGRGNRCHGGT
jgi:DNA-binding transcriptional regulator YhcF (GntR family)